MGLLSMLCGESFCCLSGELAECEFTDNSLGFNVSVFSVLSETVVCSYCDLRKKQTNKKKTHLKSP